MHCSQFNVSFLLFGLEGERFKGLPNDAIIWNQCSNAEPVIFMRDVGKDSFVRSMEIRRDEVYSRILQEMSTMDNFISR
jgi:hypothetical protein